MPRIMAYVTANTTFRRRPGSFNNYIKFVQQPGYSRIGEFSLFDPVSCRIN